MNNYKKIIFVIYVLCLSFFSFVSANNNVVLSGKVIYVDAGHGGVDPGAVYKDIKEEDINLKISIKLKEILEKRGALVYMTRTGDYDLSTPNVFLRKRSDLFNRSQLINTSDCDLYISIHLNADISTNWSGAQTFYDKNNKENEMLAKYIQESLKKKVETNREYKQIDNQYMYKNTKKPGVLVEVGFLSNANERYLLKQDLYQYKLVNAIADGIEKYIYQK